MADVELSDTQAAFLETWLDAVLPEPEEGDTDALVEQIDTENLDLSDIWAMARGRAEASLAVFRAALGKEEDPNLQRIAKFGLLDVLGGNHSQITARIIELNNAGPDQRAARAAAVEAALAKLDEHLTGSPLVDLVEDNILNIPVTVRRPLRDGITAMRKKLA